MSDKSSRNKDCVRAAKHCGGGMNIESISLVLHDGGYDDNSIIFKIVYFQHNI